MDALLAMGVRCVAVLDESGAALERVKQRLGEQAADVTWIRADVTAQWSSPRMDVWHDRAVFHFLTDPADRQAYVAQLRRTLRPGGTAILATFAPEGPPTCSGLPVMRYGAADLAEELGSGFGLVELVTENHRTPSGSIQPFTYVRARYDG